MAYEVGLSTREFWASTVREVELQLAAAHNRQGRLYDALAWHAAHVMAGQGVTFQGGGPVTAEGLLGRPPLPADPRAAPVTEEPMGEEEQAALTDFWAETTETVGVVRGRLTPEEMARARAEAQGR